MAILLIRVEDARSLPLNEFYDYNGKCYALSRTRESNEEICINFEDFYEASIDTDQLENIPVLFISRSEDSSGWLIHGWYRQALIRRTLLRPSLFLEGNILADSGQALLLPDPKALSSTAAQLAFPQDGRIYEVIEEEDRRYPLLLQMMQSYQGSNAMLRYPYIRLTPDSRAMHNYDQCMTWCEILAQKLMSDQCQDIRDIKALELYASKAASLKPRLADGHYYQAMAQYQLGFNRQAIRAIEKALKLEPEESDFLAQKACILVSMGYKAEAAELFHRAYERSGEEYYLIQEGRSRLMIGQIDRGYECFRSVKSEGLLERNGIDLQSLEKKWPYVKARGFNFRNLFRKKQ